MLPNGKFPKSFTKGINKTTKLMLKVHIHVNVVFEPILSNFSYFDNTIFLFTCITIFILHTYFPYSEEKEFFDLQKEQELSAQNISDSMPSSLMLLNVSHDYLGR